MTPKGQTRDFAVQFALLVVALAATLCLWVAWCEFPIYAWNEARLAPAFALRYGINPYPPIGGGPLSTWIYGPVGIVINLPATFANSAENALHLASLINFVVLILPLALIFFSSKELSRRDPAVRWFTLSLAILLIPRPNLVLQVADHTAVALGLLSCWILARQPSSTNRCLVLGAVLCALAVWAKQITVFLIPAQIAFFWVKGEKAAAFRYLVWVIIFGLIAFGLSGWAFGFGNLWLNLVMIPGRLPWADIPARLGMRPWAVFAQIVLPSLGLILLWRMRRWPTLLNESGRFFQLTVFAYIAMLPVGLAAYLKIGGDVNLLHSWDYLLPGCLLVWLADEFSSRAAGRLAAVTVMTLALRWSDLTGLPAKPFTAHFEVAAQLTATYPHRIWFPRNPLITFYADHQLWHSEDGIQTRSLANYGLRQPDFRRYLPANLQVVAYPSPVEFPFIMPLLSELSETTRLPYWTIHTRPSGQLVKP